jgi:hypothetical protein
LLFVVFNFFYLLKLSQMNVKVDFEQMKQHDVNAPSYWKPENHGDENYGRTELWMPDVEEFMLSTKSHSIRLPRAAALSLLQMRDGVKMRGNLFDMQNQKIDSIKDPNFLDGAEEEEWEMHAKSTTPETSAHFSSLLQVCQQIDEIIQTHYAKEGVFFKLSVRSPKDAPMFMSSCRRIIQEKIHQSNLTVDSPLSLSEDVSILRYSMWKSLQCRSSKEVITVLLRSERAYIDLLQHDLFLKGDKDENFHLNLHFFPFVGQDEGFDPDWEFRGFVVNGQRTCLTIYSPWVYKPEIVENKKKIQEKIFSLWDQVQPKIKSENYCLDFAVSVDLKNCWIVEVNNFLPPLAGCGLFKYSDIEGDRKILFEGPFEFRIKDDPIVLADFVLTTETIDKTTNIKNKATTMIMRPASHQTMMWMTNLRLQKEGKPLISIPEEDPLITALQKKEEESFCSVC